MARQRDAIARGCPAVRSGGVAPAGEAISRRLPGPSSSSTRRRISAFSSTRSPSQLQVHPAAVGQAQHELQLAIARIAAEDLVQLFEPALAVRLLRRRG